MVVYALINNVNLKCYVGQSKHNNLSKRWNRRMTQVPPNGHFRNAVKKYGPEAFTREILARCSTSEECDNLERLWIAVLRTYDRKFGYNIKFGGKHAYETKQQVKRSGHRRWKNETLRQKMAIAIRMVWANRTATERNLIGQKIRKRKVGRPSKKRGRKYGPQEHPCKHPRRMSKARRRNISEGLKKYWAGIRPSSEERSARKSQANRQGRGR